MAASETPRLDVCQSPQQTAEVNAFDWKTQNLNNLVHLCAMQNQIDCTWGYTFRI